MPDSGKFLCLEVACEFQRKGATNTCKEQVSQRYWSKKVKKVFTFKKVLK